LEWLQEQASEAALLRDPELTTYYLRALGEIGDLNGLLQGITQAEPHLERSGDLPTLNLLRLFAFAFCGQPEPLRKLLDSAFSSYVGTVRQFWLATAELAAGNEMAYAQLQVLGGDSDHALTRAVNWRLSQPIRDPQQILTESSWQILARLRTEFNQEARYSGTGSQNQQPVMTYGLIALNCLVFALEVALGGSENIINLYRLGALVPELVWQGAWWRVLAANFLHFGALHLIMNMLGLYVLGRYVETTLGRVRFLTCYFTSGIGAMVVFTLLTVLAGYQTRIVVGASGAIMGLVGVMGAIFLHGWQREKSRFAARKFRLILVVIGLQVVFDLSTPQVSFVGHTAGLIIGALVGATMMYTTTSIVLEDTLRR
jgi:rhomboid protease GluP